MSRGRAGVALLEVLVAIVIVGFAGTGLAAAFSAAAASEAGMAARESEFAAMDRVMTALALLSAEDLNRRIGQRVVGEFTVTVQAVAPGMYRIQVLPTPVHLRHALETLVFRPTAGRTP